jgi:hypothetical protein
MAQDTDTIKKLKAEYITFYEDCPIQKYAAEFIGKDEDSLIRWRKQDKKFADAVRRAKAEWVRKKLIASKAEFALERLEKEVFSPKALDLNIQHKGGFTIYIPKKLPDNYDEIYKPDDLKHFLGSSGGLLV